MREVEYEWMARLEESFWWYRGMRDILRSLSEPFLASDMHICLDAGCGTGFNLGWIQSLRHAKSCVGVDRYQAALSWCRSRGHQNLVQGDISRLSLRSARVNVVVCLDILQHLPQAPQVDLALREFQRVLRPGGVLLLRTAAYDSLRGPHDQAIHAYRRFALRSVRQQLSTAGFQILRATYANTLLFPLAATKRLLDRFSGGGIDSDVRPVAHWLNELLYLFLATEAKLLRSKWVSFPFGLSIVCIARKPA